MPDTRHAPRATGHGPDMDRRAGARHHRPMRHILLTLPLLLVACGGDPASYGITGTAPPLPPPDAGEISNGIPGAPVTGTSYGPTIGPSTGTGRFWGYN